MIDLHHRIKVAADELEQALLRGDHDDPSDVHRPARALVRLVRSITGDVEIGGIYRHSKTGRRYKVIDVARREADGESLVIYQSMDDHAEPPWARPLSEWNELVHLKGSDPVPRFVLEDG